MKKFLLFALLAVTSMFASAQEVDVTTLDWVNNGQGCTMDFDNPNGGTVFGTDAGGSSLSYVDISDYGVIKLYGAAGQRARLFINRAEIGDKGIIFVDINEEGVGEYDLSGLLALQPTIQYIHLNGVKASAWNTTLNLSSITVSGDPIEFPENVWTCPDDEIEVGTLAWVNQGQGMTNNLSVLTDAPVFGTDAGPSDGKLSYFDITKYGTLKVYGPAGQTARFFINRAEYASGTFQFFATINEEGVGELDLATVYAAQPGATYIHLNGIKAQSYGQKLQVDGVTVCGTGVEMIASNLVITEAGWATYSAPFAVNIPEGVTAYIVKGVGEDNVLTLEAIEGTIPAWQPVVLEGPAMNVPLSGEDDIFADWPVGILLNMPYEDSYASIGDYVLQSQDDKVGFYAVEESETITVPAWKCFITSGGPGSYPGIDPLVKVLYLDNAATAINKLTSADKKAQIFDINGRQINKLQKGINIVNGVKILVK